MWWLDMLGWCWNEEAPPKIMGYLPKGLSDFLRGSPGLRAFLDMDPVSRDDDTDKHSSNTSVDHEQGRINDFDGKSSSKDGG